MNHYEELGIHRDATSEEIRDAYKLAARLLHPDVQRDPRLKDLAECQMKRLSDVLAVLMDPQARARYDATLEKGVRVGLLAPLALASRTELLQTVVRHWFWVLLGSVTGVWYGLARSTDAPPRFGAVESARPTGPVATQSGPAPAPAPASAHNPRPKAAEAISVRSDERTPPLKDATAEEPEPGASSPAAAPAEAPARPLELAPAVVPMVTETTPAAVPRSGGESRFAGEWLYSADSREEDRSGVYPASYVEFRLREENGNLVGDYRARHRVLDKAISSEVAFQAGGALPSGNTGKLDWESTTGAKGELELTLRSPNQLQVRWWTTQFGRQEALSSGMAVLVRLKTP